LKVPKQLLLATRLMNFLTLLEAKLQYPNKMRPNLMAVQRKNLGNGVCDSRSILSPREKDWVPCLAIVIPANGVWTTLFLEDTDLEKPPAKLVKECMAIIEKSERAQQ
jgi:hypothetical protein